MAIHCSKNIKKANDKKEKEIIDESKTFLNKESLSEDEQVKLSHILYILKLLKALYSF